MASLKMINMEGADQGALEAKDEVFAVEANEALVHDVIVGLQANKRQGTHQTKTRGEVRGGGKKPYRQKGTGNARRGSTREPVMRGGGTVFGPHPRDYRQDVPVRFKRQALAMLLSDRVRDGRLNVLCGLAVPAPKTKPFDKMMDKIAPEQRKTLVVTSGNDRNVLLASRNITRVTVRTAADVNALDVILAARIIVQQEAIAQLEERLS